MCLMLILIQDSIETTMGGQWYDALVAIPGCDKNMPGCLIAMGRLNRPAIMIYGGTIRAGCTEKFPQVRLSTTFFVAIILFHFCSILYSAWYSFGLSIVWREDVWSHNRRRAARNRSQFLSRFLPCSRKSKIQTLILIYFKKKNIFWAVLISKTENLV